MEKEVKKSSPPMKRKTSPGDCNNINSNGVQVLDVVGITFDMPLASKQPPSCKRAKKTKKHPKLLKITTSSHKHMPL
jgi:hypothetical protein